ncbi:MAG: CBS domain-containing protein [Euryarchaeota archaeon]|nr:CBS domain-containing protein [Euryarchaeota archaeon]
MRVDEVMHRRVVTVAPDEVLRDVARVMGEKRIGCVVVMERGHAIGIVTERDILRKVVAHCRDPRKVRVKDIMTAPVRTVGPQTDIDEATTLMSREKIRRLPVVKGGRLVGILTSSDIVSLIPEMDKILLDMESRIQT